MREKITVYVPNLSYRTDRRKSISKEFADKKEFDLHIVPAIELKNAPSALWQTFYKIVEEEARKESDYFIFCEDDHVFTDIYNFRSLQERIQEAEKFHADLLSGGVSVVRQPVQVSESMFWMAYFNGMQFTVIFRRLYKKILRSKTTEGYVTDIHLSHLAKRKFVIYPYISIQKEFGYSDATSINNEEGRVKRFFETSERLLEKLDKVRNHYRNLSSDTAMAILNLPVNDIYVTANVINLKERKDRLAHIQGEFEKHPEFRPHIVEATRDDNGANGLWKTICRIVRKASQDGDDYVLICEDDHLFTPYYNKGAFFHQLMFAGAMGAELLSGGIGGFGNLVPVGYGLSWTDWFWCTQFIVIYKKAYTTILNATFSVRDVADEKLSSLLTSKLVTTPFVSEQTDFGYSDITQANNGNSMILQHFDNSRHLLAHYEYAEKHIISNNAEEERELIDAFNHQEGTRALQLGCGFNLLQGWLNTDIEPTYGAAFLDALQPFPFHDESVDYIYASHLLELYPLQQVEAILKECQRVLKENGVLRILNYSSEHIVGPCFDKFGQERKQQYFAWNLKHYGRGMNTPTTSGVGAVRSLVLSNFSHKTGGRFLYDHECLKEILTGIGFRDVTPQKLSQSPHPYLQGIDTHKPYIPSSYYEFETAILEARK